MMARLTAASAAVALAAGIFLSAEGQTDRQVPAAAPVVGPVVAPRAGAGRRIEVLFLGHTSTHHDSGRFAPMLKAALAPHGFNFSYTTDLNDLNAATLAQYDALMIYANHTRISPSQEKALLDFVAGGKGFLPIHAASFCFQNSPAYIALVGAQFQRHGTGEFTARLVGPAHRPAETLRGT